MERGDDTPAVVNRPARIGGMFDERFAGDVSKPVRADERNPVAQLLLPVVVFDARVA